VQPVADNATPDAPATPADGSTEETPARTPGQPVEDKPAKEAPPQTRRPRQRTKKPQAEWSKDEDSFFSDCLVIANNAIGKKNSLSQCPPEKRAAVLKKATPALLEVIEQGSKALAWIRDCANGSLEEEANTLIENGRVRTTPARASAPAQLGV
jgi:hypothetical protein